MTAWCAVVALALGMLAADPAPALAQDTGALIDQAMAGQHRSRGNIGRDRYRNPKQTLLFFGLRPDMTVVEISPAAGWYTEIIAPVLREKGRLYLAHAAIENPKLAAWQRESRERFEDMLAKQPDVYGKPVVTSFGVPDHVAIAPPGSADLVLTFRNVHNWTAANADAVAFKAFYDALKPGGTLGVVEHRARPDTPVEQMIKTGYMTEAYVIQLAEKAGFRFVEKSEINANPKDTKDHPNGVWSLPPMLRRAGSDRDKYMEIGESDRMTLKFLKPVAVPAR